MPVERVVESTGAGGITAEAVEGAIPTGTAITPSDGRLALVGTPRVAGRATFTIELVRNGDAASARRASCLMEVRPAPVVRRLDAKDRYGLSVAVSQELVPATADLVYMASGEVFADALSVAAVAGARKAPLLLTSSTGLPGIVRDELLRLAPKRIVIVGGETTIPGSVADEIAAIASRPAVTRITGADRYEVSAAALTHPDFGLPPSAAGRVYLASGRVFPDALSASPAAIVGKTGVLLVDGTASRADPTAIHTLRTLGVHSAVTPSTSQRATPSPMHWRVQHWR